MDGADRTDAVVVLPEPVDSPTATRLILEQQAELARRYGEPEPCGPHIPDPEAFAPPLGVFLVARLGDSAVACGGLCPHEPGVAEVKRLYVVPERRGEGLARLVMAGLEEHALRRGFERIVLETGDEQPEAIGLYESLGYARAAPFGGHLCSERSACFEKHLAR